MNIIRMDMIIAQGISSLVIRVNDCEVIPGESLISLHRLYLENSLVIS